MNIVWANKKEKSNNVRNIQIIMFRIANAFTCMDTDTSTSTNTNT